MFHCICRKQKTPQLSSKFQNIPTNTMVNKNM
jgi:hypothetical protein